MTTHLGLQRTMIPGSQVSALTTGNITLVGARGAFAYPAYSSYFLGGGSDKIEQLLYSTEVITTLAAVLTVQSTFAGAHSNNNVKGYVAGGNGAVTTVRTFTYASQTSSTTTALPVALDRTCYNFANSGVAGYVFGAGQTGIFKQSYSTETHSTLSSTFPRASNERMGAGSNNGVAGYAYGGTDGANSPTFGSKAIQKIPFSTDTLATLSATMTQFARTGGAAANSGTATFYFGGYDNVSGGFLTTDKITFSTDTKSIVGGNMASTLLSTSPGCSSNNGVAAYIAAGEDIGGSGAKNQVGKFLYSSDTHSVLSAVTWSSSTAKEGKSSVADCAAN